MTCLVPVPLYLYTFCNIPAHDLDQTSQIQQNALNFLFMYGENVCFHTDSLIKAFDIKSSRLSLLFIA